MVKLIIRLRSLSEVEETAATPRVLLFGVTGVLRQDG